MEDSGLFRHVNDSIRGLATEDRSAETWGFFCECPDVTCHLMVRLTLGEFDERRTALPRAPILAAGHRS